MADATKATGTTTPRVRARATTAKAATTPKTSTAKPAPASKAATAPVDGAATTEKEQTIRFTMDPAGDTKNYAKFSVPEGTACAGTLYVPLGAKEVRVLVIGVDSSE